MLTSKKIDHGINGIIKIPGDKSISHRSIIIPSISKGVSEINNLLMSDDVIHTLNAFKEMGINIKTDEKKIFIEGKGIEGLKKPKRNLYLGNSGTSARLLSGLLASQNFNTIIEGDKSLSKRPMKRIIEPLELMNAKFSSNNGMLPLNIFGKNLKNIKYEVKVPSAQVKSGIIFAALNTEGTTEIIENHITRNHTEIMLKSFGANIDITKINDQTSIKIKGKNELISKNIEIPSDLSSSSFFIVAALINKDSNIIIKNININPTRDGILRALKLMGANIITTNKRIVCGEQIADLQVQSSNLKGCELDDKMSKLMIDEYPILAIAASFANTPSIFKGLKELRVKESDRLELIRLNLNRCGVLCSINEDALFINPKKEIQVQNPKIRTDYDHRIAMSFAIMGSLLNVNLKIMDSESINTSFPTFIEMYNKAGGELIE